MRASEVVKATGPNAGGVVLRGVCALLLGAMIPLHAGEGDDSTSASLVSSTAPPVSGKPDFRDLSVPVASFFTAEALSDRLANRGAARAPGPIASSSVGAVSGKVGLSYEADARVTQLQLLSRRERREPGVDDGAVVLRTYYGAKRLLESVGERIRFDRSFFYDVELQETSFGTRLKDDPHDIRTVLSASRFGFSVPLHQSGLTKVSLELNADKLFQAFKGDVPQLRGGLEVRF